MYSKIKILGICGSAQNGNTKQMLNWVLNSCKKNDNIDAKLISLNNLKINQCIGCESCNTHNNCIINDDMTCLIQDLLNADVIILGSPNYFYNISGFMKTFMDRTNPICRPSKLKGKFGAFVCVGEESVHDTVFLKKIFERYFSDMQMNCLGSVIASANSNNGVDSQLDVKKSCLLLGEKILNNLHT